MKKLAALYLVSVLALPQAGLAQTGTGNSAGANRQIPASEQPGARELRNAIQRIARNRRNVDALIDAGNAALLLNDADAALNFFRQADNLRPRNSRVIAGLGSAYVRLENPFEGLRYFDEAVKLGVSERAIAADRGLAFDLLGNFERAQQDYQLASTVANSDRLTIQHAISLSLSGKGNEADRLLNPLLSKNDPAAWRARAFMLAARGEFKKSQEVTRGFLDVRSAQRIERYLKQMPALTGPQQAAAIHLGHFPAQNIGRDSDVVKSVAASLPAVSPTGGDSRLTPSGTPFGAKPPKPAAPSLAQLRISSAVKSSLGVVAVAQQQSPSIETPTNLSVETPVTAAATQAELPATAAVAKVEEPKPAVQAGFDALPAQPEENNSGLTTKSELPTQTRTPIIADGADKPAERPAKVEDQPAVTQPITPEPVKIAQAAPTPPSEPAVTTDTFDLGKIVDSIEIPNSEKERDVDVVDLSKLPATKSPQTSDAVKPSAAPKETVKKVDDSVSTTSRHWVQIVTGNQSAMRGEYRRLSGKYPELFKGQQGWSSPWKTMSRLVVGPFDGYTAAKEWYDRLKAAGGDGFVWRSAQGTKVTKLNSK